MNQKVVIAGVGMAQFTKPSEGKTYTEVAPTAVSMALKDAGVEYDKVERAYAGYMYADTCAGQRILYDMGMTGIPIINVTNACATGSSALYLAREAVETGIADCVLAFGFEQMVPGALGAVFGDRPSTMEVFLETMNGVQGRSDAPPTAQLFGGAGQEYIDKYGIKPETFAKIAVKAREHAARNPLAVFRTPLSLEEVMESPAIYGPMTRFQCCPPTTGAAAAVVCSEDFAKKNNLDTSVTILAQSMKTDFDSTFAEGSMMKLIGYDMVKVAADELYEQAGVGPDDVDVIEMHDCFTANELLSYEAMGLTPEGTAEKFIEDGDNTYGGKYVTNPSGGLMSKGHPIGATGLAQCFELTTQLRGQAGERQVEGARTGLQHNLGVGGACVMTLYQAG